MASSSVGGPDPEYTGHAEEHIQEHKAKRGRLIKGWWRPVAFLVIALITGYVAWHYKSLSRPEIGSTSTAKPPQIIRVTTSNLDISVELTIHYSLQSSNTASEILTLNVQAPNSQGWVRIHSNVSQSGPVSGPLYDTIIQGEAFARLLKSPVSYEIVGVERGRAEIPGCAGGRGWCEPPPSTCIPVWLCRSCGTAEIAVTMEIYTEVPSAATRDPFLSTSGEAPAP